jgi:hypothetical protein
VCLFRFDIPPKFRLFQENLEEMQSRRRPHLFIHRSRIIKNIFQQLRFTNIQTHMGEFAICFSDEAGIGS